jgi:membrane protease YdiL (CAAX protease family)
VNDRTSNAALLLELAIGYALIQATIWTGGGTQRLLFWITAAWFLAAAFIAAFLRKEPLGLGLPPMRMTLVTMGITLLLAGSMVSVAAWLHTLHGLFGIRAPLLHASTYLVWSLVQQYIQQQFFFARLERLNLQWASFFTALLFGVAHLPNPVLTPVTFVGGWILSELFRRYRNLYPLAFAHGVIGLAIAISVPDQIHHHMRVGLGYLRYPH